MPLDRSQSAGYLTNFAARLFLRRIRDELAPLGLPPAAMPVLLALSEHSPRTQRELAAIAAIEQPTMAATLARLERDGVVTRRPDPADGRSALIALTAEASGKLDAVFAAASAVNGRALSGLSPAERDAFLDMLKRVIAALS